MRDKDAGDRPIHPVFFESKSEIEFRCDEAAYFLEQMRILQGKARRAQELKRPPKMVEARRLFTFYTSAFLSACYGVRELFVKAMAGDDVKKKWLREQTAGPICQFFGKVREMNTHRSIIAPGMSHKLRWVDGKTEIDIAVLYGQKSSNPHMSPLYFSFAPHTLDRPTLEAYKSVEAVEGQAFSVAQAAEKYLAELSEIAKNGATLGYFN